jgi:hypothetical protein
MVVHIGRRRAGKWHGSSITTALSCVFPSMRGLIRLRKGGIAIIPVSRASHACRRLPEHHKDPTDRLIIATAIEHQARLVSVDTRFPEYLELTELLVTA